ncbi:hypothetical protein DFH27DRAFT_577328, partial [Peziza echinospora]
MALGRMTILPTCLAVLPSSRASMGIKCSVQRRINSPVRACLPMATAPAHVVPQQVRICAVYVQTVWWMSIHTHHHVAASKRQNFHLTETERQTKMSSYYNRELLSIWKQKKIPVQSM